MNLHEKREHWIHMLLDWEQSCRRGIVPKVMTWITFHFGGLINPSLTKCILVLMSALCGIVLLVTCMDTCPYFELSSLLLVYIRE